MPTTMTATPAASMTSPIALSVVGLPRLTGMAGGVLLVEADEQVGQFAADQFRFQQRRQLGEIDQPVGVPAGPVVIGAIHEPEDAMMGFGHFMEEAICLVENVCHCASTAWRTQRETWLDSELSLPGRPRL
jgi:hypothetical protein